MPAYPAAYDLLRDAAGRPITTVAGWEKRRAELLDTMLREVYGFAPPPPDRRFEVVGDDREVAKGAGRARSIVITLAREGREYILPLTLALPRRARGPVPVFLLLNNRAEELTDPARADYDGFWPVDLALARGYGMAAMQVAHVDPDDMDDSFANGVHAFLDRGRDDTSWGALRAWAWGASRCLDYLRVDPDVDGDRVAVVGHSRGGKTALLAAATDPRFALAVSNNSGCGGLALSRRAQGETIEAINHGFPNWFNRRFRAYNGRDTDLPFDQHFLAACVAPRPLYGASAIDDAWADPEGEWTTLALVDKVYQLYGLGGIGDAWPAVDDARLAPALGYHLRPGGHGLLAADWERFFNFAEQEWTRQPAP